MNKKIIVAVVFLSIGSIFGLAAQPVALAWQDPTALPPAGGGSFVIESGAPANVIYIKADGTVGIGTATPGYNLDVNGNAKIGTYLGVGVAPSTSYSVTTAGDLNIGGNDIMLNGNKRISDSTSASYTHIQPQNNTLIIYNGAVNDQNLRIYGASGTNGLILSGSATNSQINAFGTGNSLSVFGSNDASGKLTLDSTTNATKGDIIIAPSGGNIGIGTSAPGAKLQVASAGNTATSYTARFQNSTSVAGAGGVLFDQDTTYSYKLHTVGTAVTSGSLIWSYINKSTGADQFSNILVLTNGNVGVGTTNPVAKLAINGGLHVGGDTDPGDNNASIDGTLTVTGNANICNLVAYTSGGGTTSCPSGFYTWSGVALTSGYMLCCKVSNPI
ncbi:MAG: hypothetical protein M1586_01595 [Patescibacteria group bacterium]|nr:hypothetical protein [Patescibacteria group bacterium]MCL5261977.1 hypothetical protein [Patescibacteria group bacterium]